MNKITNTSRISTRSRASFILSGSIAALIATCSVQAAVETWTGATTDFNLATNWNPSLPTSADTGTFNAVGVLSQPQLTASTTIGGVNFTQPGWTLSSSSSANVLTVAAAATNPGITSAGNGVNTVSANLAMGAAAVTFTASGTSTLVLTGSVTNGTIATPVADKLTLTTGSAGTVIINPSGTNNVSYYGTTASSGVISANVNTSLGSALNSTSSVNFIANTSGMGTTSENPGLNILSGKALTVNSGRWNINTLGRNGDAAGTTLNLNGGTLATNGARYVLGATGAAGSTWTVNGGTFLETGSSAQSSGGQFGVGGAFNANATGLSTSQLNLVSGFVDVAKGSAASAVGGAIGGTAVGGIPTALFNQSGGTAQFGVTATSNVIPGFTVNAGATTNANLTIGVVSTATGAANAAYTLSGGRLLVAGTLSGNAAGSAFAGGTGVSNFNFIGGKLTAATITATNLGSNSAATSSANQVAASNNVGTLVNYGGTLAPGGDLVTSTSDAFGNTTQTFTPTTGRTALTGNYLGNGTGTLSFNLGGTAASAAFQDAPTAGKFSLLAVSGTGAGTVSLNDTLVLTLVGAYTPLAGDSLQILTATGTLSGAFTNVAFGSRVGISNNPGSFLVTQSGNNVVLSAYVVPEPSTWTALMGGMSLLVGAQWLRRKKVA